MLTTTISGKAFFAFALSLLFFSPAFAQPFVPEFGQFTLDELNMKECSFDKSADAVVLLDQGNAYFNEHHHLITERRIRLKILKEKGIQRGDIHIPYYSADGFEYITGISAVVITPDGNEGTTTKELERKNIFDRKMNSLFSMISFALPNVKVGSIIDYKYQNTMKSYGGLQRWEFQKEIPVITSHYQLAPIPNSEFAYSVYKSPTIPIDIKKDNSAGRVQFIMNNVPGLRDEVFSASTSNYLQRVNFQFASYTSYIGKKDYTTTWQKLAAELLSEKSFGSQVNKDLSGTDFLKSLSPALSKLEKLKTIFAFVRNNITWNNISSKYSEDGVKDILEKKKGNSGDINLLLVSLLKSAGLEAYPLLVSERSHGRIDTSYSFIGQFNKVVALVNCEGADYVLDGTDADTPFFMVPADLLNTVGFLIDKKKLRFVHFNNLPHSQREFIGVNATIHDDGLLEGNAKAMTMEYAKLEKESRYKSEQSRYLDALVKPYPYLKVDSFSLAGLKNDTASLDQQLQFHYTLKKSGGYYLLNTNLFTGLNENPFMTQYRFTDIDFGAKYFGTFTGYYTLPASLTTETLPANKKLVSADRTMSISRIMEKKENQLNIRYSININQELFAAEDYEMVKGFFKEMVDLLNEPVLLKSK